MSVVIFSMAPIIPKISPLRRGRNRIVDCAGRIGLFTTEHAETRFAGHGRKFENFPSDQPLAILPYRMDLGEKPMEA